MKPADSTDVELKTLIRLFFDDDQALGTFTLVDSSELPQPQRALLAHDHHMTVSVEGHHLSPVNVEVLQTRQDGNSYSRKILLTLESDKTVVQFGIVRLDLSVLEAKVRKEIITQQTPLGRILISHNVMREVKLQNVYRIEPSDELRSVFDGATTRPPSVGPIFGRTALIYCNGIPAVELLEIVGNC